MITKFQKSDIWDMELELTGICNLKCKLCANNSDKAKHLRYKNIMSFQQWKTILDEYTGLKSICLAGILSEPTLYPELFELLDYFRNRNISFELYTNGNTHNEEWWNELNKHCGKLDKVFFTVCGSTQELHEKYRCGSNLQQILDNAKSFKKNNPYDNDWIQHIKFTYNEDDFNKNMKYIINMFSHSFLINSLPYNERFGFNLDKEGISMPSNLGEMYTTFMNRALKNKHNTQEKFTVCCKSHETHFVCLDQYGQEFPCFLYRLYCEDKFNLDYSKILEYKYDFCFECEKNTKRILEFYGMERMA